MSLALKRVRKLFARQHPALQREVDCTLKDHEDVEREFILPRGLPMELLSLIISHLDKKELFNICATSASFYVVARGFLYNAISIGTTHGQSRDQILLEERKQKLLCRTLQSKRVAELVIDLRVEFRWCMPRIRKSRLSGRRYTSNSPSCVCDRMEILAGEALASLVNLQVLHLRCEGCKPKDITGRHAYLGKLPTTKLKTLWLKCQCTPSDTFVRMLSSPPMQSISTLRWDAQWLFSSHFDQHGSPNFSVALPEVKRLMCSYIDLVTRVIDRGNLTHLVHTVQDPALHSLLSKHPPSLVYLETPNLYNILVAMQQDHAPYRNIRHIGMIAFLMDNKVRITHRSLGIITKTYM